jgi:hypothetical protein
LLRCSFPKAAIGTFCSYHAQIYNRFNHERRLKSRQPFMQNVQLLSRSGSIFMPYDVAVDVLFEARSSLSDNAD